MRIGYTAWGHAITPRLRQAEGLQVPAVLIEHAQLLDAYFISARYPNAFPTGRPADYFNQGKASQALHAVQEIIRFCDAAVAGPA
jgi:HEPN domain-containing protein